jgi:uncharacterized protein with von Willebrand factor type A (vWA) domain
MRRLAPIAHFSLVLAAAFISFGPVIPERAAAADENKGAQCAALDDPAARLACFDAAFPRPPRTSSPEPPAAALAADEPESVARTAAPAVPDEPESVAGTAARAVAGETASEVQKFGLSSSQKAALETKSAEPAATAMTAFVKTVRQLPSGYLLVGLDNDQMWQQTEIDPLVRLQPGDQVTIRRAALGSHLLVTPSKYSTRVRRIQ